MFGMNKLIKKASEVSKLAGDNFASGMSGAMENVKDKIKDNEEKKAEHYEAIMQEGFVLLKELIQQNEPDSDTFQKISELFFSASDMKSGKPEPYYYLSYLFHICGENERAIKYLQVVQIIDPEFTGIDILREDIMDSLLDGTYQDDEETDVLEQTTVSDELSETDEEVIEQFQIREDI